MLISPSLIVRQRQGAFRENQICKKNTSNFISWSNYKVKLIYFYIFENITK